MASSVYVVSALAGNAWWESHVNPTLGQLHGSAYGLFQWDGGRRDSLKQWLAANGYEEGDGWGQMQYLIIENDWIGSKAPQYGFSSLTEFLESDSTDIQGLTDAFMRCWERPNLDKANFAERVRFANVAHDKILEYNADPPAYTNWETVPEHYLDEAQALHNTWFLWQFFGDGQSPFPPQPEPTDSLVRAFFMIMAKKRGFIERMNH